MARAEVCGLHCPGWMTWLFGLLSAWFILSVFGIPTFGDFWSWVVLLAGVCGWVCGASETHKRSLCPFAGIPVWWGVLTTIVGAWFVLGDMGVLPTYGINLLHVAFLLGAISIGSLQK